jgi:RHS repeat-associated protein
MNARRLLFCCLLAALAGRPLSAQDEVPTKVTVQNRSGDLPFSAKIGVDIEQLDIIGGSPLLRLPILHIPGRKMDYDFDLIWDARFLVTARRTPPGAAPFELWNIEQRGYLPQFNQGLWSTNLPRISYTSSSGVCNTNDVVAGGSTGNIEETSSYIYHDSTGAKHPLRVSTTQAECREGTYSINNSRGPALSGSGIVATLDPTGGPSVNSILFPDGTQNIPTGSLGTSIQIAPGTDESHFGAASYLDVYGNAKQEWPGGSDTLGRAMIARQDSANQTVFTVHDASGNPQNYTVNYVDLQLHTAFNIQGIYGLIHEYSGTRKAISSVVLPNGLAYNFKYDNYGMITEIDLPTGATITYTWDNDLAAQVRWVTSRTLTVGNQTSTWTFQRQHAQPADCNIVTLPGTDGGCRQIIVTDPQQDQSVYAYLGGSPTGVTHARIYQGAATGTALREYAIDYLSDVNQGNEVSLPTSITTTLDNGFVSQKTFTYDQESFDFVECPQSPWQCAQDLTLIQNLGTTTSNGNVLTINEYGFGKGAPGTLIRTTTNEYLHNANANYLAPNIVDSIIRQTITDGSGATFAKTEYEYDNATQNGPFLGSATKVSHWRNTDGAMLATTYSYDSFGNIISITDPKNNQTAWSYDDNWVTGSTNCLPSANSHAYVTQRTNALGQRIKLTRYPCTGQIQAHQDENDLRAKRAGTTFTYDLMNRPLITDYPDGGQTSLNYHGDSLPPEVTKTELATPNPSVVTSTSFDQLMRPIQTSTDSDTTGAILVDTGYDALGRKASVSNPYRSKAEPTYGLTQYQYDALSRTTQITHPDGTAVVTNYTGPATQVTDEGNGTGPVQRISETDVLGRLTSVCEVFTGTLLGSNGTPAACGQSIPATGFLTTYQYDLPVNSMRVQQSGLQDRVFQYNSLSELLTAFNPESGSMCYGTLDSSGNCQNNGYDVNGNLQFKTDARKITTTYSYDKLNRLTGKSYSDATPAASFNYDETTAGTQSLSESIGRRTSESSGPTAEIFSYEPMGRLADSWQCTPQSCGKSYYNLHYQYDLNGNVSSASNGMNATFSYGYDAVGRLNSMSSSWTDATHPATLLANAGYGPFGLTDASYGAGGGGLWNQSRIYDNRGRVTSQTDVGLSPATPGAGGFALGGAERTTPVLTQPASTGGGTISITGAVPSKQVATTSSSSCGSLATPCPSPMVSASATADGAIAITISGKEQQNPTGLVAGTGSVSISGAEQPPIQIQTAAPAVASVTIGTAPGGLQSKPIVTHAATPASGSIVIGGAEHPTTATATVTIWGSEQVYQPPDPCMDECGWPPPPVYDNGTMTITVGGYSKTQWWSQNDDPTTIAGNLAWDINQDGSSPVTASASGATVTLTAKTAGNGGNLSLATSWTFNTTDFAFSSFTTTTSGGSLTGGGNDTGTVSVTINGTIQASYAYGISDTSQSIATALASQLKANSGGLINTSPSGGLIAIDTGNHTGSKVNYPMIASVHTNNPGGRYPAAVFTVNNAYSWSGSLTGGTDEVDTTQYDTGTTTITVNNVPYSYSWSGSGTTAAVIAGKLRDTINGDSTRQVNAIAVNTNSTTSVVNLTTINKAQSTNSYPLSTVTTDGGFFPTSSFTSAASSAFAGGLDNQFRYDIGTVTLTINCNVPGTTPVSYTVGWGPTPNVVTAPLSQTDTAQTVAQNLFNRIPSTGGPVKAQLAGNVVNLTAWAEGDISNYPICVSVPPDTTPGFSNASFTATPSGATLTGGWPNHTAVDAGTVTVNLNQTNYSVPWGKSDSPQSIAQALAAVISQSSTWSTAARPTVANVSDPNQSFTVYVTPNPVTATGYQFSTSVAYDTTDFLAPSFAGANSIFDAGQLQLNVNGHSDVVPWTSSITTPGALVLNPAPLNGDGVASITANANGNSLGMVAKQPGNVSNYSWTANLTHDSTDFSTLALSAPVSGQLGGGHDAVYTNTPDTGTVSSTIGGNYDSVPYGASDTPASIASALASVIKLDRGSVVNPTVTGNTVSLKANSNGGNTDYNFAINSATNSSLFAGTSFLVGAPGGSPSAQAAQYSGTLAGGADLGAAVTTLYSYSLGYAGNGNVLSANDSVNGNWAYQYDLFNRLQSGSNAVVGLSWQYDRFGNRLQQNVSKGAAGSPQLSFSGGNNRIDSSNGFVYDASGNVLYDPGLMLYFQYDAESRLVCTDSVQGGCNTQYIYNAEGDRVAKKTAGSITNQYLLDPGGANLTELDGSGAFVRGEIDAGLIHLGTYFNGSTYFEHGDWTGTMRLRTGLNNEIAEQCTSLPFGDSLNCTGVEPSFRHFTGKERDSESGLDYFGARYYGSAPGRFMTPDWSPTPVPVPYADFGNPQFLNLYAYVRNNPTTVEDPDGHCCGVDDAVGIVEKVAIEHPEVAEKIVNGVEEAGELVEEGVEQGGKRLLRFGGRVLGAVGMILTNPVPLNESEDAALKRGDANRAAAAQNQSEEAETEPEPQTSTSGAGATQGNGRGGKQARLRELGKDDKVSSADRGQIKRDQNEIARGKRTNIRVPTGKELAHRRGKEARKGHNYKHSDLQSKDLHRLQHKHEGYK